MAITRKTTAPKVQTAQAKGAQTATLRKLSPIAKEINVRMEKASKAEKDAQDHRLSACHRFAEAKELCEANKVNFKKWCEENVEVSYHTARKLVAIGQSDDPRAALEDLRVKTAKQMKASRAKAKATVTPSKASTSGKSKGSTPAPALGALDALRKESAGNRLEFARDLLSGQDKAIVDKATADRARKLGDDPDAWVIEVIGRMAQAHARRIIEKLARSAGGTVRWSKADSAADFDPVADLPEVLRRTPAKKPATRGGSK